LLSTLLNGDSQTRDSLSMIQQQVLIPNKLGLHARAAAQLVRTASRFTSRLKLERIDVGATADAKSILSVLMLAASCGTTLQVMAEGEDEQEAVSAVCSLIVSGFGEE
jgi:phosphocarrier protein HPr